jgi:sugar phosphate isomerase/epimerase
MKRLIFILCIVAGMVPARAGQDIFRKDNLVAWCIVPFDAKKRGPEERAAMLERLGIKRLAYDWRAEHVPAFEAEIEAMKRHGIEFTAFWGTHEDAFKLFEKHGLKPHIWVMLAKVDASTQEERVKRAAQRMLPLVGRAKRLGCPLGLYNHGGWGGEPENMTAVTRLLREQHGAAHAGIVYNLHHGHDHLDRFATVLAAMKPYLLCLNLNGMTKDGDKRGMKILPLGQGDLDLQLLRTIRDSGYRGPIGILNHTGEDAETRLKDNLDGLNWLVAQLDGKPAGPKPQPRSWRPPPPRQN